MNEDTYLLIDDEFRPILIESECDAFKPVLTDFIRGYTENRDKPIRTWLEPKLQAYFPETTPEAIKRISEDIITSIENDNKKQAALNDAIAEGRSKEGWFASEVKKATSAMTTQEASRYLAELDGALQKANISLFQTISTQAGNISKNPSLDGFIAEQYHAQTFNMNANAAGSQYRAKVLEPNGKGYAKNSVDLVITDSDGNIVRKYQSKYCKDAKTTERAFEHGDYRGQRKLVPDGQEAEMTKKASSVIEAPDGITSNPLTKPDAEQMRNEAQSGNWNDLNWNEYNMKDLAVGIGKQAGYAALQGALIGVGIDVAQKLWRGEKIEADELAETAIVSGADFGIKAAAAGALKVGIEKEIITVLPKGTPASTCANIAFVAVENVKIVKKMITRELTVREGIDKIEQTSIAIIAGLSAMGEYAAIGAAVCSVFGPVGTAVGGFIGGAIGYMAGSKVGEEFVKGLQRMRDDAKKVITNMAVGARNTIGGIKNGIVRFTRKLTSAFSF